ncbi:hypothetical protein Taro_005074 [Colocasia esculenta]|uniref:Uncharacterized protein n=1 Tax=Colocasia esculenta TaxID=4460 RepID=A0A843TRD0_COLES|nr:hypothetical protein [Colocasia esculenta]
MSYENRSWMYRGIVNGVVTEEFKDGVDSFIQFASSNSSVAADPMGNIRCSCSRYGTWRTESDGFHVRWPRVRVPVHDRDCLPVHAGRPGDRTASPPTTRVVPPFPSSSPPEVESQHPAVEEGPQLLGWQPCWISGGNIDPGSASRYIMSLVYAHIPGPVDAWREFPVPIRDLLFDMFTRRFAFMRPEDLP